MEIASLVFCFNRISKTLVFLTWDNLGATKNGFYLNKKNLLNFIKEGNATVCPKIAGKKGSFEFLWEFSLLAGLPQHNAGQAGGSLMATIYRSS